MEIVRIGTLYRRTTLSVTLPWNIHSNELLPLVAMAVVDQYGRVRGMEALRIADASIMPNCVRANTNVTTMMIGERIAEFVRQGTP